MGVPPSYCQTSTTLSTACLCHTDPLQSLSIPSLHSPPYPISVLHRQLYQVSNNSASDAPKYSCDSLSAPTTTRATICCIKQTSSPLSALVLKWKAGGHRKTCPTSQSKPWTNWPEGINGERLCITEAWTHHKWKTFAGWTGGKTFIHHAISLGRFLCEVQNNWPTNDHQEYNSPGNWGLHLQPPPLCQVKQIRLETAALIYRLGPVAEPLPNSHFLLLKWEA